MDLKSVSIWYMTDIAGLFGEARSAARPAVMW
jgi:hypothetical protein